MLLATTVNCSYLLAYLYFLTQRLFVANILQVTNSKSAPERYRCCHKCNTTIFSAQHFE